MSTSNPETDEDLLDLLPQCITEADNDFLTRVPNETEIMTTLKAMKPWKAPGRDGFPPGFFQSQWSVVKHDVIKMI